MPKDKSDTIHDSLFEIGQATGGLNIKNNKTVTNVPINLFGAILKHPGKLNFQLEVLVGDEVMMTESKTLDIATA